MGAHSAPWQRRRRNTDTASRRTSSDPPQPHGADSEATRAEHDQTRAPGGAVLPLASPRPEEGREGGREAPAVPAAGMAAPTPPPDSADGPDRRKRKSIYPAPSVQRLIVDLADRLGRPQSQLIDWCLAGPVADLVTDLDETGGQAAAAQQLAHWRQEGISALFAGQQAIDRMLGAEADDDLVGGGDGDSNRLTVRLQQGTLNSATRVARATGASINQVLVVALVPRLVVLDQTLAGQGLPEAESVLAAWCAKAGMPYRPPQPDKRLRKTASP